MGRERACGECRECNGEFWVTAYASAGGGTCGLPPHPCVRVVGGKTKDTGPVIALTPARVWENQIQSASAPGVVLEHEGEGQPRAKLYILTSRHYILALATALDDTQHPQYTL